MKQKISKFQLGSVRKLRNLIIGSGIQNTAKPNKLLAAMTVCRHDFNNGVMAYMLQFGLNVILKPDDGFLPYNMAELFNKTGHGLIEIIIA